MAIILLIRTEDEKVVELPILDKIKIGRSSASDYKIADTKMSGIHCSFQITPQGELLFTDLDSSNGSFLNNSKITQTLVRINDIIRIGNTVIKIDETKLTSSEKSLLASATNKTVKSEKPKAIKEPTKILAKKKAITLNKDIKVRKGAREDWGADSENVIEQDASSGLTKMLKLDKNKKKK